MKTRASRYLTLLTGILVAASVILSQSVQVEYPVDSKVASTEMPTDSTNGGDAGKSVVTISPTSLPAATAIQFTTEAVCLFEILFADSSADKSREPVVRPLTKFLSTLLSVIISPNAP